MYIALYIISTYL